MGVITLSYYVSGNHPLYQRVKPFETRVPPQAFASKLLDSQQLHNQI